MSDFDFSFKLLVVGEEKVGKTGLFQRLVGESFADEYAPTPGMAFAMRSYESGGKRVRLTVWDTGGAAHHRPVTSAWYGNCDALLLLFDLTNRATFEALGGWLADIAQLAPAGLPLFLIGCKADLPLLRQVPAAEAQAFALSCGAPYVEVAAKEAANTDDVILSALIPQLLLPRT